MRLHELCERVIAFNPVYVKFAGVTGALFLSQAIYWTKRSSSADGWFYKTRDEWLFETGLSRREQETARKRLVDFGILEEMRRGHPCKLHFKIDFGKLDQVLYEFIDFTGKDHFENNGHSASTNPPSSWHETSQLVGTNPPSSWHETSQLVGTNPPSYNNETKITTEITTKITKDNKCRASSTCSFSDQVNSVFDFWKMTLGHDKAQLDRKRYQKIKDRLKDGYTVEQLKQAIEGCSKSAFHMGHNENGRRYDSVELIFRSADKVDYFIANAENPAIPKSKAQIDSEASQISSLMYIAAKRSPQNYPKAIGNTDVFKRLSASAKED